MLFLASLAAGFLAFQSASAVDPLVDLSYSKYQGVDLGNNVTQWLGKYLGGIRYAAPPLGNLRFEAPQDPPSSYSVQPADKYGAVCLGTGHPANETGHAEDCLFLNVFAPSDATEDSGLAVYFFIQGGGFNTNSNPNLNGSGIVTASDGKVITVQMNYRVGAYGFLAAKEVPSNNNGLKDQRKALEWVQKNIKKFGGDPKKVTMAGDSAGAASVTLHLTAYGGRDDGLFQATAAESQSFAQILTVSEQQYVYDDLVIRTGCAGATSTLGCLRDLNTTVLQNLSYNIPFTGGSKPPLFLYGPTLDNDFLTDFTYRAFEEGKFVKVPAIYGDDTNEGTIFAPEDTGTSGDSSQFIHDQFPSLTVEQLGLIAKLYPVERTQSFNGAGRYWRQASDAYGEIRYICPGIKLSQIYAWLNIPIYNYRWNVLDPQNVTDGYGVPHTIEVNAIWGPANTNNGAPASYNTTNAAIVPIAQAYWTSFVKSHNPNTYRLAGTPEWKQFGSDGGYSRLRFQTNNTAIEKVPKSQRERCDYLDSIALQIKQ
ncbi:MAG: hypothetical protein M1820_006534 [Bogoriella megaspora]|nr:MAG: hypothetical protein M1820_006534 [Bogoriella megaspora]